jgi:Zn-dependent protease
VNVDPAAIIIQYICLLFALSVHEAAHAAIADRRGDPTGRLLGRVTLNPIKHIDPVGTVVMPIIMMFTNIPLFGWAKPVPYNPRNLKDIRRDPVLVALAGPASNILLMAVFISLTRFVVVLVEQGVLTQLPSLLLTLLGYMIVINFVLAVFNMIPVPPLDGHHLLHYFLPSGGQRALESIGPFGIIIAIVLIRFIGPPLFQYVLIPILRLAGIGGVL